MRKPKEPKTFKYPRLYWSPDCHEPEIFDVAELRIIYPDGSTDRVMSTDSMFGEPYFLKNTCCWDLQQDKLEELVQNPLEQLDRLKEHCLREGASCIFIGEIK